MGVLEPREGYRLWAPTYADETAISQLEDDLVSAITPSLRDCRLLDAGCGTGRRLRMAGAASAVGVDLTPEMLAAGIGDATGHRGIRTVVGDVRDLPLPDRAFDVIWCRLVIGHVPDCRPVYKELARVADAGALIIVSDFHPAAHAAGHRRTFRSAGEHYELAHHVHTIAAHLTAAGGAGLTGATIHETRIGPSVRHFYEAAGRPALYDEHLDLPVVLAFTFRARA